MSNKRYMDFLILRVDEETVIPLSDTGSRVVSYVPKDEPGETITETIAVANTVSEAAARTQKRDIERFFELARQAQANPSTPRTYLRYQVNTDTDDMYRSEVLDGSVSLIHSTQSVEFRSGRLQFVVTVKRRNYYEAEDLVELPLNGNPTGAIIDIFYEPSAHTNILAVDGDDVAGDLHAPIILKLKNASADSGPQTEFWVGHNIFSSPGETPYHMLEGEDAWNCGYATVTEEDDADCSGGHYAEISWESTDETLLVGWTLTSELLALCRAGRFALLPRLQAQHGYTDLYLRLRIQTTTNVHWQSDLILAPDKHTFWMDNFNLPPLQDTQADGDYDIGELSLIISGQRNQAGVHTLKLDYAQLTPISEISGLNYYSSLAAGVASSESLFADEINKRYFRHSEDTGRWNEFTRSGKGLHVLPGRDQAFYVTSCFGVYTEDYVQLAQEFTASAWYRPRRRSI